MVRIKTKSARHSLLPVWFAPQVEVHGHRAYGRKASMPLLLAARTADLSLVLLILASYLTLTRLNAHPSLAWGIAGSVLTVAYIVFFRLLGGRTPGEIIWQLRRSLDALGNRSWLQYDALGTQVILQGAVLTLLSLGLAAEISGRAIFQFPVWQNAETLELNAGFPSSSTAETSWATLPFFYGLGALPARYQGVPISYRLPYEKGPPTRFLGHIVALWETSEIQLTFEGPKTPSEDFSRTEIQNCLRSLGSFRCFKLRQAVLSRHTEEMMRSMETYRGQKVESWKVQTFQIKNPAIPEGAQSQGFILSAMSSSYEQSRYVFITPKGLHQALILDTPQGPKGAQAHSVFLKSLESIQTSDDLNSSLAWVDHQLENIRLSDLETLSDPLTRLEKYLEIQALLLAKISVDPKTYDSYYHLAGVSLELSRFVRNLQAKSPAALPANLSLSEILSSANGLIESSYRYALDIRPQDPRTQKIKDYLTQADVKQN